MFFGDKSFVFSGQLHQRKALGLSKVSEIIADLNDVDSSEMQENIKNANSSMEALLYVGENTESKTEDSINFQAESRGLQ